MGVPNHIFIDTCIFERAGFNFESAKLKPFRAALKELKLTFLDPDPTFRERNRHLRNRVVDAVRSLEKIEKSLPVVTSLEKWPKASFFREYEIHRLVNKSLVNFLKPMKQVKLGYDGIDMHRVMSWYDQGRAPFGKGKKRKEFPDAFAIAILDRYAQSSNCEIAVVSTDTDFERACAERIKLLYFPSLAAYLQVLQGESDRVRLIQQWFKETPDAFNEWVADAFSEIEFEIEEGWDGELTDPEVDEVNISDFYIVAVADRECTVSFEAEISFSINADYEDENDYEYDYEGEPYGHPRKQESVYSTAYTTVLSKIKLDDSASRVEEIIYIDLDITSTSVSVSNVW
jgi:hypothetical protein